MKFVRFKSYVKDSSNKHSFIIELSDSEVLKEYTSEGCHYVENIKPDNNERYLEKVFNKKSLHK